LTVVTITLNPSIDKTCRVERVVPERKLRARQVRRYPGGGGINVARVITRLGGEAKALWSCGGSNGGLLCEMLDAEGVPQDPVRIDDVTRENLIVRDESSGQQYRFGMPGTVLTPKEQADWLARLSHWPEAPRLAVFSGSIPPGVSLDWYGDLLASVPAETHVIVDTKRDALAKAFEAGVYLAKPNVLELEEVVGRELRHDEEIVRAAQEIILRNRVGVLLVSLGGGGVMLVTAERAERLNAPAVKVRSKVGAGDSMVGGLAFALDQGSSLRDAAIMAVAAGAAAVMTEGTELCHRHDVEHLRACMQRESAEP
jgi:6-phosphofructokinase 2